MTGMADLIAWWPGILFGSVWLGYQIQDRITEASWRRQFMQLAIRPPMITTPPTTTELHRPEWIEDGNDG